MKIFYFSCELVIGKLAFKICSAVINGENHVKSHQKCFVFLHMKPCNENLLELPVQYNTYYMLLPYALRIKGLQ